jgi:hypothetical protein
MVRDAIRYISDQLDITVSGGRAKFAGDALAGYRYLKQSSWDWLPMVGCEFMCLKTIGQEEYLSLSYFIISDTGFIEGDAQVNEKENVSAYKNAADSSTKFVFILRKTHWGEPLPFMEDKVQMKNFIKEGAGLPNELIKTGVVGKCYDMSCLASESSADKIVSDIIEAAKQKSWPLGLKKTPLSNNG